MGKLLLLFTPILINFSKSKHFLYTSNTLQESIVDTAYVAHSHNLLFISSMLGIGLSSLLGVYAYRKKSQVKQELNTLCLQYSEKEFSMLRQTNQLKQSHLDIAQQLNVSNNELNTFLYRASHDLKGPIASLQGLCEVAKMTCEDPISEELFEKINEVSSSMNKMLEKISLLHNIQNDNSQQESIDWVRFEADLQQQLEGYQSTTPLSYRLDIHDNITDPFQGNTPLIQSITRELIENAFTFRQGTQPEINVKIYQEQENICIQIQDNGRGIPAEMRERIFEMYFKGDLASEGHGLGLYIVQKAVKKLNGQITLESLPQGSQFSISIPMQA
ncbi:HAMP domain-containing sensor histidine kinase [Algivirga pacifica]|uniref:histidine kinase n=1 Tax=Algivirga pacifica TaxID=1162670 RepID=A0ABP9DFB6_9BACT